MAKEINIQAILTFQRNSPSVLGAGNKDIDQASAGATHGISNVQKLTGGGTWDGLVLNNVQTSANYYVFLKNLDNTANVDLAPTADTTKVFGNLRPQEFCLLPIKASITISAKSSAAGGGTTSDLLVVAADS
jgi:hypothetical protein